jgi:hypothetical protein
MADVAQNKPQDPVMQAIAQNPALQQILGAPIPAPVDQTSLLMSRLLDEAMAPSATRPVEQSPMPDMGRGPMPPYSFQPMNSFHGAMHDIGEALRAMGTSMLPAQEFSKLVGGQSDFEKAKAIETIRNAQVNQSAQRDADRDENEQRRFKLGLLAQLVGERNSDKRLKYQEDAQTERERFSVQQQNDRQKQSDESATKRQEFAEKMENQRESFRREMDDKRADQKDRTTALKVFGPALDSAERYHVMLDAQERGNKGDQQADVNLVANHLGMTMGLQKGARITRDAWTEAMQSAPWLQRVTARFDKDGYLSGVVLTPQQRQQMVELAKVRYSEDVDKARTESDMMSVRHLEPDTFKKDGAGGMRSRAGGSTQTEAQGQGQVTHIVKDAKGNRIGTVQDGKYVADKK